MKINKISVPLYILFLTSNHIFADEPSKINHIIPPQKNNSIKAQTKNRIFPDYKLEKIIKLIETSDMFRQRTNQKKNTYDNAFNTYFQSKFLVKKVFKKFSPKIQKITKVNNTYIAKSNQYKISIPLTAIGKISMKSTLVNSKNKINFISLPNIEKNTFVGQAKVAQNNTVIYQDFLENTDIAVQAFKDSLRILTILNDADAPQKYKYNVNVPIGGQLKKLANGAVLILDKKKKMIGGFAPPWAIDKNGKKVPTHFEIKQNLLIQIVEHLDINCSYPIIADPFWGKNLIGGVSWFRRRDGLGRIMYGAHDWIQSVYPTDWAKFIGKYSYIVGSYGWDELTSRFKTYYNLESMKNQYICHQQFAFHKNIWHLDEWRPNVGYWATVNANCNP